MGRFNAINVLDYGATGDGSTDDTAAIQAAIDAMPSVGGVLEFAPGTYIIDDTVDVASLNFVSMSDFLVEGNRATIKAKDGMAVGANTYMSLFSICSRFVVRNLTLDGNRDNRTPASTDAHNIRVRDCVDARFENVICLNGCTDGWYISPIDNTDETTFCERCVFQDCVGDNCYRQGMSIINGFDLIVRGGRYSNTTGAAPSSGIDIEPNSGTYTPAVSNVLIEGVKLEDNDGCGIMVQYDGRPTQGVVIHKCTFSGNQVGGVSLGYGDVMIYNSDEGRTVVRDCDFYGARSQIYVVKGSVLVDGCSFRDVTAHEGMQTSSATYSGCVHIGSAASTLTPSRITNCNFNNLSQGDGSPNVYAVVAHDQVDQIQIVGNVFDDCYYITRTANTADTVLTFKDNVILRPKNALASLSCNHGGLIADNIFDFGSIAAGGDINVYNWIYCNDADRDTQLIIRGNTFKNHDPTTDPDYGCIRVNSGRVVIESNSFQMDTPTDCSAIGIASFTNSDVIVRNNNFEGFSGGTNAVVQGHEVTVTAEVTTTDGSATTLYQIPTTSDTSYHVRAEVVAVETNDYDETASYELAATFRNDNGTLSRLGTDTSIHEQEDTAGWDCELEQNSTNIRLRVTGAADVNWKARLFWLSID